MGKSFLYSVMILTGVIVFSSCQKEVDPSIIDNNNPPLITGNLKAKIDGTQWVANSAEGASRMLGLISIGGRSTDRKYLTITLTDSGVHNYTLDNNSMNAASYTDSSLANAVNFTTNQGINPGDAGGFVNITSIDVANKRISGSFSFR
ncbi:MAG TPA: DUF6252 family protein, partial [Chitinophagaceae bacterium]